MVVTAVAGNLDDGQGDVAMSVSVGRMWETAISCISSIKKAHQEMLSKHGTQVFRQRLTDVMVETKRFLWCGWLCNMRESVIRGRRGFKALLTDAGIVLVECYVVVHEDLRGDPSP
jgi:hypothetical protein